MHNGAQAYAQTAKTTATPRDLEAQLLLRSASRLQAVIDGSVADPAGVRAALEFNRKIWTILVTSATSAANPLPLAIKQNIGNLGVYVLRVNVELELQPEPQRFRSLVSINRDIAAGLMGRAAAAA